MAIYTLSTSANYSAIKSSLANGDTIRIDTNAVRLTINEQPLLTNITVDSPGVSGRVTVSGAYDLSTWSMVAGTATLIDGPFPAGATLGTLTSGAAGVFGCQTNNGTITTVIGGNANGASGVGNNNGTIINTIGGGAVNAHGCVNNNATVTNATGSSTSAASGVVNNNGTITTATGGSAATAYGVTQNNSTVRKGIGGTNATAHGVNQCDGICLEATDSTGRGVNNFRGGPKLINGPEFRTGTTNYTAVSRIYSIGQVSNLAAIPGAIPITILTEGSGGFSGIKGVDRNIGT
jgi:hypothetical protein